MTHPDGPAVGTARGGSLRRRIVAMFAGVALALSVGLGVTTYLVVRSTILDDRDAAAVDQVAADASLVVATLDVAGINAAAVLATLRPPTRSRPLLSFGGRWYTASLQVQPDDVPLALREAVFAGEAAMQRFALRDEPVLVVGVPLPDTDGGYFEVFSLRDVEATLGALARTLAFAGAAATAIAALAGWGISRRIVRPLDEIGAVAEQIASGQLGTRLDTTADRDLARLTTSFNAMADSLERRIQQEARFSSDVSHELRSPLTTVATAVSVLERRREELSPEGREALDLLSADVARLQGLVADLLEIARHDAGAADVERVPFAVVPALRRMLRRLADPDLDVEVAEGAAHAIVAADEGRLERTLANILANARIHAGGATRVVVETDDATVRVAVEDAGPGIDPEERELIFERFSRGHGAGNRGSRDGSGLGLALAQENMRAVGGRVEVEDVDGRGARFVIELPRADT